MAQIHNNDGTENHEPPKENNLMPFINPNAPTRPLSAFFWFSSENRGKVKNQNPEFGVGDIAKELGRQWAEADDEVKAKYEALADKDKIRYEKEIAEYKEKINYDQHIAIFQAEGTDEVEEDKDE